MQTHHPWKALLRWYPHSPSACSASPVNVAFASLLSAQQWSWPTNGKGVKNASSVFSLSEGQERSSCTLLRSHAEPSTCRALLSCQSCGDIKYFLTKRNWIACLGEPWCWFWRQWKTALITAAAIHFWLQTASPPQHSYNMCTGLLLPARLHVRLISLIWQILIKLIKAFLNGLD